VPVHISIPSKDTVSWLSTSIPWKAYPKLHFRPHQSFSMGSEGRIPSGL
jgi:hypothetical protein